MTQFAFDGPGSGGETGGAAGGAAGAVASLFAGVPALILCNFVDRDQDGLISAEDIFTTQALILQRSESFLRVVFRMYVESVWYPGRQLNMLNLQMQANRNRG